MQSLTHFPFFLLLTELNGVHYLAPVVQKVDSAIQRINRYPVDSAIGFPNTYPLDSNYPMDSAIQRMNKPGLEDKNVPITWPLLGGCTSPVRVTERWRAPWIIAVSAPRWPSAAMRARTTVRTVHPGYLTTRSSSVRRSLEVTGSLMRMITWMFFRILRRPLHLSGGFVLGTLWKYY